MQVESKVKPDYRKLAKIVAWAGVILIAISVIAYLNIANIQQELGISEEKWTMVWLQFGLVGIFDIVMAVVLKRKGEKN